MLKIDFSTETLSKGTKLPLAKAEGDLNLLALFLHSECLYPYLVRGALNWLSAILAAGDGPEAKRLGMVGGDDVTATFEDGKILLEAEPHVTADYPEHYDVTPEDFKEVLVAWMKFMEESGLGDPPEMAHVEPIQR